MSKRLILALSVVIGASSLSGCWESSDVTVHAPGKYKGKMDPFLNQQAATREEALKKRFQLVQIDR